MGVILPGNPDIIMRMEIILVVLAFLLLLAGLAGSVVPAIPGPPLGYAGLLLLKWSGYGNFSLLFLLVWAGIVIAITVIDNILPAFMTKRFGGSRMAVAGSVIGLIAGTIFFAPAGLLIGPFLGALVGELLNNQLKLNREEKAAKLNAADADSAVSDVASNSTGNAGALKAALGAFLAFIVGTGAKLIIGALMIYYAVRAVF